MRETEGVGLTDDVKKTTPEIYKKEHLLFRSYESWDSRGASTQIGGREREEEGMERRRKKKEADRE